MQIFLRKIIGGSGESDGNVGVMGMVGVMGAVGVMGGITKNFAKGRSTTSN